MKPNIQRPSSALPKPNAFPVPPQAETCRSSFPLGGSTKMSRLLNINRSLQSTLELAVQSFGDKKQREEVEVEKSAEMDAVLEDDEVVNKETYAMKKKELKELVKELNERDNFVNQQKSIIQKLNHQIRILKTQVQDPLEVLVCVDE
jgi:membrane-bound ClpP family serine protease